MTVSQKHDGHFSGVLGIWTHESSAYGISKTILKNMIWQRETPTIMSSDIETGVKLFLLLSKVIVYLR